MQQDELLHDICDLWAEILGLHKPADPDAHYLLLGGDSLQLTRILARVSALSGSHMSLTHLVDFSTPRKMAAYCAKQSNTCLFPPAPVDRYPATALQQGLWFAEGFGGGSLYANAVVLHMQGDLQVQALHSALNGLPQCYPVLRSCFRFQPDTRSLVVSLRELPREHDTDSQQTVDCTAEHLQALLETESNQSFDLAGDVLLRWRLFRTEAGSYHLLLCCHHVVCDGWSCHLLLQNLAQAYRIALEMGCQDGMKPEKQRLHAPKDHGMGCHAWQEHTELAGRIQEHAQWWQQQLGTSTAPQQWLWQANHSCEWPHRIKHYRLSIEGTLVECCRHFAQQQEATLFTLMLLVFKQSLARFSGCSEQLVLVPVSCRSEFSDESVGCFIDMLPSRSLLSDKDAPELSLRKEQAAFDEARRRLLPLNALCRHGNPPLLPDGNPWSSILFAFQNFPQVEAVWPGLQISTQRWPAQYSPYALKFEVLPGTGDWTLLVEYAGQLLSDDEIRSLVDSWLLGLQEFADMVNGRRHSQELSQTQLAVEVLVDGQH
jgi:hypothetical protein